MSKRVTILIAAIATGLVVAFFIRSPSFDKADESARTTPASATVSPQRSTGDAETGAPTAGTLRAVTSPPAGERPRDVCRELSDRQIAREQAARDTEPKDSAWAYPMEQKLREFTSDQFQANQIEVIAIECKTTFCEISARGFVPETTEQFNKVIEAVRGKPWNDFSGWSISHDMESGKRVHHALVSRMQSKPAREQLDDMQRVVLRAEEQALAACTAQVVERQERARAVRDAEPRDPGWADPMEQLLRQHITAQLAKHPVEHMEIACRATFCKIKATGKTMDSQLGFQKVSQQAAAEPWANLLVGGYSGGSYGDDWQAEVTLNRR